MSLKITTTLKRHWNSSTGLFRLCMAVGITVLGTSLLTAHGPSHDHNHTRPAHLEPAGRTEGSFELDRSFDPGFNRSNSSQLELDSPLRNPENFRQKDPDKLPETAPVNRPQPAEELTETEKIQLRDDCAVLQAQRDEELVPLALVHLDHDLRCDLAAVRKHKTLSTLVVPELDS